MPVRDRRDFRETLVNAATLAVRADSEPAVDTSKVESVQIHLLLLRVEFSEAPRVLEQQ